MQALQFSTSDWPEIADSFSDFFKKIADRFIGKLT
jgi:hypothetical protein